MNVYRITTVRWSTKLTASGYPARWNSKGRFVLYTTSSRALACLENVVHRSGEGLNHLFKVMVIEFPYDLSVKTIYLDELPENWDSIENYSLTQAIGDDWVEKSETAILKVPSVIIPQESVYLFNLNHPEFMQVKLINTESFSFDIRIKDGYSIKIIPEKKSAKISMSDNKEKNKLKTHRFDIAVSFAGEDRQIVEKIVNILGDNGISVFYDKDYQAELWGKDLYQHLNDIYKNQARFCLVFVSENYAKKLWTKHEFKSAQDRAFNNQEEYILPLRLDDTELPGLNSTTGYLDFRYLSISEIIGLIAQKVFA